MKKKIGIVILAAFLAMGVSACNISGGDSALEKAAANQSSQSQKSEDSTDSKLSEVAEKKEKTDDVESKTESSKAESSEVRSSDNKSLNTDFAKFMSEFKDNYEAGKKIVMKKSEKMYESIGAAEISIFKVDGKECIITDMSALANLDSSLDETTKSLIANKQIMISDEKYTYLVTGNTYQKFDSEDSVTSTYTAISDAFENIDLIKVENGYEYFKVKTDVVNGEATIEEGEKVLLDDESSGAEDEVLVTKVKDGVCYIYRNTPDVLYMTIEYSDVTDEDKKAVDLSQYKESETDLFTTEDEEANNE